MHYLSHFYTESPVAHPLFAAALTIPDLSGGFSRAYNKVIKHSAYPEEENLRHIHSGILSHYEADKKFHYSPLFVQHTSLALQSFIEQGLNRNRLRLSVIAHLAVEMLIDRQILLENESLCFDFYSTIVQADETMLETYFMRYGLESVKSSFFAKFIFFKQGRYLFLFKDLENIVYALSRVYGTVTKTSFTPDEKVKFLAALHNIDEGMRYSWKEILKA